MQEAFEVKAQEAKRKIIFLQNNVDQLYQEPEASLKNVVVNPLLDYEKICPPGGSNLIILYTTTVKTIPKTFQDCSSLRLILNGFKVLYQERDVSMHVDFRDELWRIMGKKVALPRLFIKGSYIGGADEVLHLHEQGKFRPLLAGIPIKKLEGPCKGCAGNLFLVCPNCSGSKKVNSGGRGLPKSCMNCNENGLIKCPICFWNFCSLTNDKMWFQYFYRHSSALLIWLCFVDSFLKNKWFTILWILDKIIILSFL